MQTAELLAEPAREALNRLLAAGEHLPKEVARSIIHHGREVVPALIEIVEDDALAQADGPGGGFPPIHAAELLGELKATEAIEPMLRTLSRCDSMAILYSTLIFALKALGPPVLEPALAAYEQAQSEGYRRALADVLSRLSVRDERILSVLLKTLKEDVLLGAGCLAEYGDPSALPHLSAALDVCELDPKGDVFANQEIIELDGAIEELGGKLTADQARKVRAARSHWHPGEGEAADRESAPDLDEILRRFEESAYAKGIPGLSSGWIQMALDYGAEYEGASFATFDARALRAVLFELFPRKVSCEASEAPHIVRSLRAFWTFAKEELTHPHAAACLAELGEEAINPLRQKLADPSNYGTAKAFFMLGRRQGYDVETEEGMWEWSMAYNAGLAERAGLRAASSKSREEQKRKKRLRKLKKQAQRRSR